MRIENILQTLTTQFLQKKGSKKSSQPVNSNKDMVEISTKARDLQKNHNINNSQLNTDSPIQARREEKIKGVISKIDEGYYSSPKVISKIVDNLFKRFGI